MYLFHTVTLLAATLRLTTAYNLQCDAPNQARFTEARLANIIDDLRGNDHVIQLPYNGPCVQLGCRGGTGAWACSEGLLDLWSRDFGDVLDQRYKDCHSHTPQSTAGDNSFAPAFESKEPGYRIFVHGSQPC